MPLVDIPAVHPARVQRREENMLMKFRQEVAYQGKNLLSVH
jgi:hypothetical protein